MAMQACLDRRPEPTGWRAAPRCPQCDTELILAERSEFTGFGRVRNIWHCEVCAIVFDTDFAAGAGEPPCRHPISSRI